MFRFFLIILMVLISFPGLFAQTFSVTADTTGTGTPGSEIVLGGRIFNLTGDSLTIEITRTQNLMPGSWATSICLENCFAPWISKVTGKIAPNDSIEYSLHFLTDSTAATGQATLQFNEYRRTEYTIFHLTATTVPSHVIAFSTAKGSDFKLMGNFPNPFNSTTIIRFFVNQEIARGKIEFFSVLGQLVFASKLAPLVRGVNEFQFSAADQTGKELPGGIYIYRVTLIPSAGALFSATKRLIFIK